MAHPPHPHPRKQNDASSNITHDDVYSTCPPPPNIIYQIVLLSLTIQFWNCFHSMVFCVFHFISQLTNLFNIKHNFISLPIHTC